LILAIFHLTGLSSEIVKIIFLLPDYYNSYILKIFISVTIYVLGASTIIPISVLNYFMGVVFGYPIGIVLALFCNFLSCTLAYWIFKHLNFKLKNKNNLASSNIPNKKRKVRLSFSINNTIVKIAYACLILPFSVIVSSITSFNNISFETYIVGMLLGTAPSCLIYSFFGTLNTKTNPFLVVTSSILMIFLLTLPIMLKWCHSLIKKYRNAK